MALAQVMRPWTPSSVQRTRLPIFKAGRLPVLLPWSLFLLAILVLPACEALICGQRDVRRPTRLVTYLSSR
jgi:hypothetical protein